MWIGSFSPSIRIQEPVFAISQVEVLFDHHFDQPLEIDFGHPAEFIASFCAIAQQDVHFGRACESLVKIHKVFPVKV